MNISFLIQIATEKLLPQGPMAEKKINAPIPIARSDSPCANASTNNISSLPDCIESTSLADTLMETTLLDKFVTGIRGHISTEKDVTYSLLRPVLN
jgi:hypothetical protein